MIAANLSTTEIEAYTDRVAVIPLGAFEQHGPHLPLGTDAFIAEELAKIVERNSSQDVILFPTIWFGDSIEHQGFAGTLSIPAVDIIGLLTEFFRWLEAAGFTRALLYNGHGGNIHLAAVAAEEFSRTSKLKVKSMYAYTKEVKDLSEELFAERESHAGSSESSLLYALRPDLTPPASFAVTPTPGQGRLSLVLTKEFAPEGIIQSKSQIVIDLEKGKQLADLMQKVAAQAVESLLSL